jgi:hypothetical protein
MAGNADNAANDRTLSDESTQDEAGFGSWDPHQVWLTRVKQPRDSRHRLPKQTATKQTLESLRLRFWTRTTR